MDLEGSSLELYCQWRITWERNIVKALRNEEVQKWHLTIVREVHLVWNYVWTDKPQLQPLLLLNLLLPKEREARADGKWKQTSISKQACWELWHKHDCPMNLPCWTLSVTCWASSWSDYLSVPWKSSATVHQEALHLLNKPTLLQDWVTVVCNCFCWIKKLNNFTYHKRSTCPSVIMNGSLLWVTSVVKHGRSCWFTCLHKTDRNYPLNYWHQIDCTACILYWYS